MLRQHDLDDERYADVLGRARAAIAGVFPAWNDLNAHDPGVTLLELFVWLTETQRFHLDRSEEAAPFFPILGVRPRRAKAAEVTVTLSGASGGALDVPQKTPLYAEDVRFETTAPIRYDGKPTAIRLLQRETLPAPVYLGEAYGFPSAVFRVDTRGQTLLRDDFELRVDNEAWQAVDDFRASGYEDKHYTLNDETGEIRFGDGFRGMPPTGAVSVSSLSVTRAEGGNVAANRITALSVGGVALAAAQPEAAAGGAAGEDTARVLSRWRAGRRSAVTAEDIERLVYETPSVNAARVRAYPRPSAPEAGKARVIAIAVKLTDGALEDSHKAAILARLEPYRLACRAFEVTEPDVVPVGIAAELRVKPHGGAYRGALERGLRGFFAEAYGGFGAALSLSALRARLGQDADVLEVTRCAWRVYGEAKADAYGDVRLPQGALAELGAIDLRLVTALY